jgi:hypothetical protein
MKLYNIIIENELDVKENKSLMNFMTSTLNSIKSNDIKGLRKLNNTLADDLVKIINRPNKKISGVRDRDADDLVNLLKSNKLSTEGMGDLMIAAVKTEGISDDFIRSVVPMWVNDMRFLNSWAVSGKKLDKKSLMQKGYSSKASDEIIEYAKNSKKFQDALSASKVDLKKLNNKSITTDIKAAEDEIRAGVTNATKNEAEIALTQTIDEAPDVVKPLLENNKNIVKSMSEKAFDSYKKVAGKLSAKWLFSLGLTGAGGVYLLSRIFGGRTTPDSTNTLHPKCITDLLDKDGSSVIVYEGNPVVMVTKTGNEEYDKLRGLKFYTNNRVFSGDNSKRGKWSCKGDEVAIQNETINEQITDTTMYSDVNNMIDYLDFPVSSDNLQSALNLLTKYSTSPRGKEFLDLYRDSGFGSGDLKKSLKYVISNDPKSVDTKKKILGLITKIEGGSPIVNTTSGGLDNISIAWDTTSGNETTDTNTPKPSRFFDCESAPLPHKFGCKSSKIAEVQKCLGVVSDVVSDGKFGPNTLKALKDAKYSVTDSGLTQIIYDTIKKNCSPTSVTKPGIRLTPEKLPISSKIDTKLDTKLDTTTPIIPPKIPTEPVYDMNRLYELLSSKNLVNKRNGIIVKWKGPELNGNDYYILNKYLSDQGYTQKSQREVGDRDDEDVNMRYKWKKNEE